LNETSSSTSPPPETTEVLYGNKNIIKKTLETYSWVKERMEALIDNAGPAIHILYEPIWNGLVRLKERGVKIRRVTEITPDNVSYCKKLMEVCELRHLDGVRTNFGIDDGKQVLLHGVSQEANPLSQAILTSARALVEAQEYLFENLWKNAIPAQFKIKEIEEGVKPPFMETLRDPLEIQKIGVNLIKSAKQEIQMLLLPAENKNNSSTKPFLTEERKPVIIQLLKAAVLHGIRVRILTSKVTQEQIEKLIEEQQEETRIEKLIEGKNKLELTQGKFEIHFIDRLQQQRPQAKASILVVDSKICLVEDLKEYKSNDPSDGEMLSLATYSNRESVVLSYISIFETLWTQTELTPSNR
jgi:two-component system, OmpR family, sensor histidine kinase VicK